MKSSLTIDAKPEIDHLSIPDPPRQRDDDGHPVDNVPPELPDQNLYLGDRALLDAVDRDGIGWVHDRAVTVGAMTGSTRMRDIARAANAHKPTLRTHDRVGRRIDTVDFHPAYHEVMAAVFGTETHSLPWIVDEPRPQTARNVLYYLWNQVENGVVSCTNGMTWSIVALLRGDPEIGDRWLSKVLSTEYDPRPLPVADKAGISVAMAMTEKQGGSDLRTNSTRATPTGADREYTVRGHKYFVSAPMADILLLTAQTEHGITLFIAPRILDDGTRNNIRIHRLKHKLGNSSNATSEVELDDAIAYRIGDEGGGIREFVRNMTHYTRMALATGSAGIMRRAVTLAIHHTSNRQAFGKVIRDQPVMRNALADLAVESEAALLLGMRMTRAADDADRSEADALLNRVLVPVGKYWNCRRASAVTLEAMECHGGLGYIEEQPIALLYREAPLNSIWEGTSVIMGLDVQRALHQRPEIGDALLAEIGLASGADRHLDGYVARLETELVRCADDFEPHSRRLMSMIALALQASLLVRASSPEVADAFCSSRLRGDAGHELGTLDSSDAALRHIVDRAAID